MFRYIAPAFLVFISYIIVDCYLCFRRNLSKAKRSGIPYIVVPIYWLRPFWLVTHPAWLKVLRRLPNRYTTWVDYCLPDAVYSYRHELYERAGHDTFLTVAPGGISLWTSEPSVISQVTTRRNDFPKPTGLYRSVDIYGKNVVSTEGQTWRHHRKATSPPFTEKNNQLVWNESIDQARAMLACWVGSDGKGNKTVERIMDDTMRLSLHVISRAGFGKKLEWPLDEAKSKIDTDGYVDRSKIKNVTDDAEGGHTMSYTYALHCLLDNILFQFLLPRWVLERTPLTNARKATEAFREWGNYMNEMVTAKKKDMQEDSAKGNSLDILAQLVKGQVAGRDAKGSQYLSDSEILGNMFVLILAGHETAANSIHFAILNLALFIPSQRRLQKELDQIFQGRSPSEWDYEKDLPALFGGMTGAILAEELRLTPPVLNIPKSTFGVSTDQPLVVDGKDCIVPTGIYVSLSAATVQRNPKYWPSGKPLYPGGHPVHPLSNLDNDLEEFRPERWLLDMEDSKGQALDKTDSGHVLEEKLDNDGIGVNEAADNSDRLYKPPKGAYLPFSDGYRACLGRRFAQVEILATLAVIFQNFSVELAVDKYASDEEVDGMGDEERGMVWQKAAEDARDLMLNGCGVVITLQMRKGAVSVRFVPRGEEKFSENVDEVGRRQRLQKEGKKGVRGEWTRDPNLRLWS